MSTKLSIVVPCYNEEMRITNGFNHYFTYLNSQKYSWELIFVNDGSQDKTLEILQKLSKGKPNIKIISYKKNRGKGYAIVQGVKLSKGKFVLFTDIDHSVPIETIESFFNYFRKGYKVIIGSRRISGSRILIRQPYWREFLGRGFTLIVNIFIYPGIKDATCGFKAFETKTARKIFNKIKVYDWAFDAEILFLCKKNKMNIIQAPVSWKDARGSKVALKKDIIGSFIGILRIQKNNLMGKY